MTTRTEVVLRGADRLRVAKDGFLRLGPLGAVPELLREFGADPAQVLTTVGLDPSQFRDPDHLIPFVTMGRLLNVCAERTRCPHFGLLVGQRAGGESLGLVGDLMQSAPDVGSALRSLILYFHLHDQGGIPVLTARSGVAMFAYGIYQPAVEGIGQIHDGAIAIAFNIMRSLCGPAWAPTEVLLARSKPANVVPHRRFFGISPRFDAEQAALVFRAAWLDRRLPGADSRLRQMLETQVAVLEAQGRGDVVNQLRRVLRSLLTSGGGSLHQVADLLSIHRRTLNRRLRERGTTFKALVDEARFEIARQFLEETGMPITGIAAALDYADSSAFTRAFRRWSGTTPADWRRRRSALTSGVDLRT